MLNEFKTSLNKFFIWNGKKAENWSLFEVLNEVKKKQTAQFKPPGKIYYTIQGGFH